MTNAKNENTGWFLTDLHSIPSASLKKGKEKSSLNGRQTRTDWRKGGLQPYLTMNEQEQKCHFKS